MKPNDPITVCDGGLLVHVRVHQVSHTGRHIVCKRRGLAGAVAGPTLKPEDEHIKWCRGHVTEKDEAGAALLAIAVMGPRQRAIDLDEAENLYRSGVMTQSEWLKNLDLWDTEFDAETRTR